MAVSANPYGAFLTDLGAAVHNFATDTIKVALLAPAYTANLDTHNMFDDVSGNEVSGTGYTAGGVTLGSKTWTYDTATDRATLAAATAEWAALTLTARYAVIYKSTGVASTSPLIGLINFGEDRVMSAEAFQLSFPSGVVRLTAVVS